jgi:glucose-6-phosphate 1-dehydrogenase
MALVLMGQPARMDAGSFRGVRVEGLRAVATPAAETMRSQTVRGRYTAGTIGTRQVPSYVDEPGADPSRNTETYASLTLQVNSPRWAGVPFTLRSGKALAADSAEIAIHFGPLPRYLPGQWPGVEPNVLRVGLTGPYVRLSTTFNGSERTAGIRRLEARPAPPRFTACAHLILQMLNSSPMLFIRGDEAEEAWRIAKHHQDPPADPSADRYSRNAARSPATWRCLSTRRSAKRPISRRSAARRPAASLPRPPSGATARAGRSRSRSASGSPRQSGSAGST